MVDLHTHQVDTGGSPGPLNKFKEFVRYKLYYKDVRKFVRIVILSMFILYFVLDLLNDNITSIEISLCGVDLLKSIGDNVNYSLRNSEHFRDKSLRKSSSVESFCDSVSSEDMKNVIKESVDERITSEKLDGASYTLSSIAHVHPCIRRTSKSWYLKDVLFIVMASSLNIPRTTAILETWATNLTSDLLILGDADIPEIGMITLPGLGGKTSREDAQHRTLKGLQYAVQNRDLYGKYAWIFMVDDDTWVNIYELPSLIFGWDVRAPFLLGFIWNTPNFGGEERPRTWPSGGAGMLVTRAAAEILAKNLYTEVCPFNRENDLTIGLCAWQTGVALVHSALFDHESLHALQTDLSSYRANKNHGDIRSLITMHRAEPKFMREWQAVVERYSTDNRLALTGNL